MDKVEIIASLRSRLCDDRFFHSLNVAEQAKKLASIYGEDEQKAYLAGLVHDCTKNTPPDKQLEIIESGGIHLSELEKNSKKLWHAISGSVFIQSEYGIDDKDIISAVRYHTTGKADMSMLEKIVYTADFTSKERDYKEVDEIRFLAETDINKAVFEGARFTVESLKQRGLAVHPDTIDTMNFYK